MKATLIFSTLFLFAAFMGCSDNFNVTDPSNQHYQAGSKHKDDGETGNIELIWSKKVLSVTAGNDILPENSAIFSDPATTNGSRFIVEFDVYTNANKMKNGYSPLVQVISDGDIVYQSSEFPDGNGNAVTKVEFKMNVRSFNELEFYIALTQVDSKNSEDNGDAQCTLSLSGINVYRID